MKLYSFQEKGVEDLITGFKSHRTQCLAWYTGAGKTNVFLEFSRRLIKVDPKVKIGISAYITTEIKEQVYARSVELNLRDVSHMAMAGSPMPDNKNIYIFNPQTLYKRPSSITFDYLIIDEGHVGLSLDCKMIAKIRKNYATKDTKILLVSATPWDTLALEEFKGAPVYKRPLDYGLKDGLVTDFTFHAEEALITFSEKDFTRSGDLGLRTQQREMAVLKSSCLGKMEYLLGKYNKEIGKKCVVICPPGNLAEVARTLHARFGGSLLTEKQVLEDEGHLSHVVDNTKILADFKNGPARFLFVINKCSVGFDMQNLSSIIDLTMTRNVLVLAQRCGRIARKNGNDKKHYFYVYDQSLMKDRLEWLVSTMIDFCLGAYDGWTTKSAKYRRAKYASNWSKRQPAAVTLSEIVKALRDEELIENRRTLTWLTASGPPTKWTLERAKKKASEFSSRTEMWSKCPALYKWFRLNAKSEMDYIFPLKNKVNYWNHETVEALMKKHTGQMGRREFLDTYRGPEYWLDRNRDAKRQLFDKYFPRLFRARWTDNDVLGVLSTLKKWNDVRTIGGVRSWMLRNGGESYWRNAWLDMIPKETPNEFAERKAPVIKTRVKTEEAPISVERKKLQDALAKYREEREQLRKKRNRRRSA